MLADRAGDALIVGFAPRFRLDVFRQDNLTRKMELRTVVRMPNREVLEPLIWHLRQNAPNDRTPLARHHQFMVPKLAYLEEAFVQWQVERFVPESKDHLSMQIMFVAPRLSTDPLGAGVGAALAAVPCNGEYSRRACKDRIGLTPQKIRQLKRMEFGADRLGQGGSVKVVAAELG